MRPRHYTAENNGRSRDQVLQGHASMRPRHYTAENTQGEKTKLAGVEALQ